jgi:hypothetical protein
MRLTLTAQCPGPGRFLCEPASDWNRMNVLGCPLGPIAGIDTLSHSAKPKIQTTASALRGGLPNPVLDDGKLTAPKYATPCVRLSPIVEYVLLTA